MLESYGKRKHEDEDDAVLQEEEEDDATAMQDGVYYYETALYVTLLILCTLRYLVSTECHSFPRSSNQRTSNGASIRICNQFRRQTNGSGMGLGRYLRLCL